MIIFFLGTFIEIVAGSLFQIFIPLLFAVYFFLGRDSFSGSLLLLWVGKNLVSVGIYASDAVVMRLPLLGGEGTIHDWNYILSSLGILNYANGIGQCIQFLGYAVMIAGVMMASYIIFIERNHTTLKIL